METQKVEYTKSTCCCAPKEEKEELKSCCSSAVPQQITQGFWHDNKVWTKAAKNTFNCLIGCSIGDFGTLIAFQHFAPQTPMLTVMGIAIVAGLTTSVIFETVILHLKEGFGWSNAFKTAFSMSFLSMVAMELSENATDFMLTGGNVLLTDSFYWVALGISLTAGFLVPLPYNYYKLKKHGKACH
jgi:hypothetical protein